MTSNFITILPIDRNPVAHVAQMIVEEQKFCLPDLNYVIVLLPDYHAAGQFRTQLLRLAGGGLLLPRIYTPGDFLDSLIPPSMQMIPQEQRLLMLVNVLHKHRSLYGSGSPWLLAADLLKLFDELTLHRIRLPSTPSAFADILAGCYHLDAFHPTLLKEAHIVHTLWQAWHEQLLAENWIDKPAYYLQQLSQSLQNIPPHYKFYMAGFNRLLPAETEWISELTQRQCLSLVVNGDPDESGMQPKPGFIHTHLGNPFSAFLHSAFNYNGEALLQRAHAFKASHADSPALNRLHIYAADSFEHEIQLLAQTIRMRLQNGDRRIGVITEDRKLARRLRAYLERNGIEPNDSVGWTLSTTRSAALLESWLQCIENDFPYHAFLDLLKSTALAMQDGNDSLKIIYRFETDIVLHESISSGIGRYQKALLYRAGRLPYWNKEITAKLQTLLNDYGKASSNLHALRQKPQAASVFIRALLQSMEQLDLRRLLARDEAGQKILLLLERMQHSAAALNIEIDWIDFRIWLGHTLETHYFSPPGGNSPVQLLNLQQSALQQFDSLIIASADERQLPGPANTLPFFNDAVRHALKLPAWQDRLLERQFMFRCLLENNSEIFISWQKELNGEPVALSPWIEIINRFHALAYGATLVTLAPEITQPAINPGAVSVHVPECPRPSIDKETLPAEISVSAHQRLINCPYQFYVYDVLRLKPPDEIREALQKSDYGNRIHKCLEAFHHGAPDLPGPFQQPLKTETRAQAIAMLEQITLSVFTRDIEDNFLHRGWMHRWLSRIPAYIDWQIEHGIDWTIEAVEQEYHVALDETFSLRGRIDRVERNNKQIGLIDYKTGKVPTLNAVLAGEEVQLLSYSLLLENVQRVQYLGLDKNTMDDKTAVDEDTLPELSRQVRQRLLHTLSRIRNGDAMPALGKPPICDHCTASGLCRRKIWQKNQKPEDKK